jgi:ACS family sodium-dependent inorganic phosphate cotransporter
MKVLKNNEFNLLCYEKAGVFSALPYLMLAKVLYLSGLLSDYLVNKKMSYTTVRRLFCCSGLIAQAFFMILTAFSTSPTTIITFAALSIGIGGMPWAAFGVNHLDIGAGYANILMSISNTFATLPGIISPVLTGHLIENRTKSEWDVVFVLSAFIYLLGALVYGLLSKGETQSWAVRLSDLEKSDNNQND